MISKMDKKINIYKNGKNLDKGVLLLSSSGIQFNLKKEKIKIRFDKITKIIGSLTMLNDDDLNGLSFRIMCNEGNKKVKYDVYFLDKNETEKSFEMFMKQLRKKVPLKKSTKEDNCLGEYTQTIKSIFIVKYIPIVFFLLLIGLSLYMVYYFFNIYNLYSYLFSAFFIGLTIFIILVFRNLLNSSIRIILEKDKIMFLPRLGKEYTIYYKNITSFNRKWSGQGYDYFFTTIIDGKQKKLYLGNMDKLNKLVSSLKQKLKNVPQNDLSSKKPKKWAVNRSY